MEGNKFNMTIYIGLILSVPPVIISLWIIASFMTREVSCDTCGKRIKLREGELVQINLHHSSLDKYRCPLCAANIEQNRSPSLKIYA
jgi:hypothetical protein